LALDRASTIWVEPETRNLVDERPDWARKARERLLTLWPREDDWLQDEVAWIVPDTPSLYPPLYDWLSGLDPSLWSHIAIISGIPRAMSVLDQEGLFLPPWVMEIALADSQRRLVWREGQWEGEPIAPRVRWGSPKPLHGRVVMLLRQGERSLRAVRWLEEWGAQVITAAVSVLQDPVSWDAVDEAMRHLSRYDWIVFTSQEAVRRWFQRLRRQQVDVRTLRAKVAVVGPETAIQVREWGIIPDLMPEADYSQEGLIEAFRHIPVRGSAILLPGGQRNRTALAEELRGRGALVDTLVLYQNRPAPLTAAIVERIQRRALDAVIFTASSQVEYLFEQLGPEERAHLQAVPSFSIGPLTTRTLRHYGVTPVREADEPSIRILAELVREYLAI
jgi:uroporphyrinogen-III synthase